MEQNNSPHQIAEGRLVRILETDVYEKVRRERGKSGTHICAITTGAYTKICIQQDNIDSDPITINYDGEIASDCVGHHVRVYNTPIDEIVPVLLKKRDGSEHTSRIQILDEDTHRFYR